MKKIILSSILILILGFSIFFIFNKEEENNNLKKVTIAEVAHSVFYAPQYLAHKLGYYEEEGLDIEFV